MITAGAGPHERRLAAFWGRVADEDLDAVLLSEPVHLRYLTGFSGSSGQLVLEPDASLLITDGRYASQVGEETEGIGISIVTGDGSSEVEAALRGRARVGWESERISHARAQRLMGSLPAVEWRPVDEEMAALRMIKGPEEIEVLRRAASLADDVFKEVAGDLRPGRSEFEIAGIIEGTLRRLGSEGSAFEPIVASGPRGALPHGRSTGRRILEGELVTIDFGAVVEGYHSDLTRTVAVGGLSQEQIGWCGLVEEALEAALARVRPGIECRALDEEARRVIDGAGFGDYFVHNLGHGLGLEVHEGPRISRTSEDVLEPGMVFTLEPGVYLPERGGVRIEEDVLVTDSGPEVLTRATRAWDA